MTGVTVRVLHVDDEPGFGDLVATFLEREREELDVVTEQRAEDALARLSTDSVDCVVSDYDMPTTDGIEFLRAVREDHPDLPFILFTGKGSEDVAGEAIAAGVTDYLQKQAGTGQYELLANRIVNAVDRSRAERHAIEQERISDVVRRVNQALVRADSRTELEAAVSDALTDSDVYRFAWVGRYDPDSGHVEPTAHAGIEMDYLEEFAVTSDGDVPEGQGPGGRAIRTREVAVTQDVTDDPAFAPWREAALERGFRSVAGVPIVHEADVYGIIGVYANRTDAFDDAERQLLAEVGANVGHAIDAIQTTEALRESSNRIRAITEALPDLVLVYDADGHYREVVTGRPNLLVFEPDDVEGNHVTDVLPSDAADTVLDGIERTVATGETQRVEYALDADGTTRRFDGRTSLLPGDGDGTAPPQVVLLARDVTDQKRTEARLREEKRRFQGLLETNPGGVLVANDAGEFVFANQRIEQILGVDEAEIVGRTTFDDRWNLRDLAGNDLAPEDDPFHRVRQSGDPVFDVRFAVETPGGGTRYLSVNGAPLHDDAGTVERVLFSVTDVTSHIEREQALERYRLLVQTAGDPMYVLDEDGFLRMTNRAMASTLGYDDPAALEAKHVTEHISADDFDRGTELLVDLAADPDRNWGSFELQLDCLDGRTVRAENKVAPLTDDDGRVVGSVGVLRDVGARVARERELRALNEKIEHLQAFTTELQTASDRAEIFELSLEAAADILGFDWSGLAMAEDGWLEMKAVTPGAPVDVGDRHLRVDEGVAGEVFQQGVARVTADEGSEEAAVPVSEQIRSGLTAPVGDRGVFQAASSEPAAYDEDDLRLAELLAAHVDEALERVANERVIRELNDKVERLHGVATDLQTCQTASDVYDLAIAASADILGFDWSVIGIAEDGWFELVAVSPDSPAAVGDRPLRVDEGTAGAVYQSGESRVVANAFEDDVSEPVHESLRANVTVPLGDIGVFQANAAAPGFFDESDLELVELLAAHVTEALRRVERERVLYERERELVRQNERLERFASVVSHDLRNPLQVAMGNADLLDDSDPAEAISLSLDRMDAIVSEVLELARQGATIDDPTPVSLEAVAERAWRTADTAEATLRIADSGSLRADESRFVGLLENLFHNAVRHGGPDVAVTVGTTDDGFFVADDGPGIPAAERENVLKLGYTTATDGTGFGLAIVTEIADAHGWTLSVGEGDQGGARFDFGGVDWTDRPA